MSKKTRLNKLSKDVQNKIKYYLLHNGMTKEDISCLWDNMTLSDISDYMDIEEVFA